MLFLYLDVVVQAAPGAGAVLALDGVFYIVGDVAEKVDSCKALKEIDGAYLGPAHTVFVLEE